MKWIKTFPVLNYWPLSMFSHMILNPPANEKQAHAFWVHQFTRFDATVKYLGMNPAELWGKENAKLTPEQQMQAYRESNWNPLTIRNETAKKFDMKDRIILANVFLVASFVTRLVRPTRAILAVPFLVPEVFRPLFGTFYFKK